MTNTIFVQIAAYTDPELIPTLLDMFKHSDHPENLHVSVCWQHLPEETTDIFLDNGFSITGFTEDARVNSDTVLHVTHKCGARLSVIDVDCYASKGACWARHHLQQLYDGEKYTLQLDSHHRFVEHWDTLVIEMLESLRYKSKKPLLTGYIPSFDPENDPAGRVMTPWKMDFDRFIPEGTCFFLPAAIDNFEELNEPLPSRFYSAHFAFADGSFAQEVQHFPEFYFHGEEQSIAVRAFTHGYDLYHPHRIIAWHEYTRKNRKKSWDLTGEDARLAGKVEMNWVQRNDKSHALYRILFGVEGEDQSKYDFGKYGFGTERTVEQYEEYAGIDNKRKAVTQEVLDKRLPPGTIKHDEHWVDNLTKSHDIRILFHRDELKGFLDGCDFWYVGSATYNPESGEYPEVFRKDYQANDIKKYIQNEWIDNRLIWLGNTKATHFVVWPHHPEKGWGERIVKEVPPFG